MKHIVLLVIISFLFGGFDYAAADTFIVPLKVSGTYAAGDSVPFNFDLGVKLLDITEVRFYCKGAITAGLSYYSVPFSWAFQAWMPASPGYWIADGAEAGDATWPAPEDFEGESVFYKLLSPTWDFLLDGAASGWVELPDVMFIPEYPPLEFPAGSIESAYLTIIATPERRIPIFSFPVLVMFTVIFSSIFVLKSVKRLF